MTCKLVILGPRKDGLSHDDCIGYLETEHAPKVMELPGLQKYRTAVAIDPDEAGFDEMAELWFDDPVDMEAAFESAAWKEVMHDAENFVDTENAVMVAVTDEQTHRLEEP